MEDCTCEPNGPMCDDCQGFWRSLIPTDFEPIIREEC